jgi:hypothetical protein
MTKQTFQWHKLDRPLVTNCCTSLNWVEVFPDEEGIKKGVQGGTLCGKCKKVKRNNVHRITLEEYRTVFNRPNITHREFNNLYSHD